MVIYSRRRVEYKFHHPDTPSSARVFVTKRSLLLSIPGKRPRIGNCGTIGNCATPSYRPNETIPKGVDRGSYSASLGCVGAWISLLMLSATTPACLFARNPCLISYNTKIHSMYCKKTFTLQIWCNCEE